MAAKSPSDVKAAAFKRAAIDAKAKALAAASAKPKASTKTKAKSDVKVPQTQDEYRAALNKYTKDQEAYLKVVTPTAKILAHQMPIMTGHPTGHQNLETLGPREAQPFFDVAEKVLRNLKISVPEKPVRPEKPLEV